MLADLPNGETLPLLENGMSLDKFRLTTGFWPYQYFTTGAKIKPLKMGESLAAGSYLSLTVIFVAGVRSESHAMPTYFCIWPII
jgi:hypothetical protein